jgi:hypothetical protein
MRTLGRPNDKVRVGIGTPDDSQRQMLCERQAPVPMVIVIYGQDLNYINEAFENHGACRGGLVKNNRF